MKWLYLTAYYVLVTPLGIIRRLKQKIHLDLLCSKAKNDTFWVEKRTGQFIENNFFEYDSKNIRTKDVESIEKIAGDVNPENYPFW